MLLLSPIKVFSILYHIMLYQRYVCVCKLIYVCICLLYYIYVKCESIYRAMCDLEWYKLESKKGRTLILLMLRGNEPFQITAGGIVPLTMTTFCSVRISQFTYL